jgi:MFS family permease
MNRLRESARAFHAVFANRNLRRIQLGLAGSVIAGWAYGIALSVYAYEHGGAAAVGYVNLLVWIPAAALGPFMAILADRFPRKRVMIVCSLVRAVTMGAMAAAFFAGAPSAVLYALAVFSTIVGRAFVPAQAAILPSLASTPEELTASNVTSSTIESIGIFVGPALGGLILAASDAGVAFAFLAGAFLWSALMVSGLRLEERPADIAEGEPEEPGSVADEALAGFRAIAGEGRLRLIVSLFAGQTFVDGVLNVLVVVLAFEVLEEGATAVGYLNSAIGIGGLAGALGAMMLIGRGRLANGFGFGMLLFGVPIALIALWPNRFFAIGMLLIVGVGNTVIDVAGMTLMQRTVADAVLARAFGVLDALLLGTVALGSLVAPAVVAGIGARGALIATGAVLPVLAVLAWKELRAIDAASHVREREVALLRGTPIFAPLPEVTVERLSSRLAYVRAEAGEAVIREGDHGDRFYIVSEGELEASQNGTALTELGPGSYFGEIALLRDVPRTATVTAKTSAALLALDREDFVAAVTGHAPSAEAADAVVVSRLAATRPSIGAF